MRSDEFDDSLRAPPRDARSGVLFRLAYLDTTRFDRLSPAEVIDRIGELLALAAGRLEQQPAARAAKVVNGAAENLSALAPTVDAVDQRIVAFLEIVGYATARETAAALGLTPDDASQRLARLTAAGVCRVIGEDRPARYALRDAGTASFSNSAKRRSCSPAGNSASAFMRLRLKRRRSAGAVRLSSRS